MGYTLLQIGQILAKADKTMYKIGSVAYDDMFSELDEKLDYERDIIYIYKKAVEYADDYYVGTEKLDAVVERLASKVAVYDYGSLSPIYTDVTIVVNTVPSGAVLNDLADVTITNLQNNQILRYDAALGQWINTGTNYAIRTTQSFTATLNQTVFTTTSPFQTAYLDVYLNGVRLNTASYSTFGQYQITLADGCFAGDIIDVIIYDPVTDILDLTNLVPYTGATTNVDLGEYELKAGQIELDQSPTGTAGVAVTRWNDTTGVTETTLKGGSVVLKNGIDLVARVVNKVTPNTTLTKAAYQAVRVSGAQGQRLAVAFAQANNDNNSADTIGLVTETIATNQEGFIMTVGQLEDINTTGSLQGETWSDGDVLYLSPTVAGAITNVKPIAPQHLVIIGYVEYAHANHGKIYVKVMNGWELGELHDVDTTGATNGQVLTYNGSIWTPQTNAAGNIYNTDGTLTGNRTVTMGSYSLSFQRDITINGAKFGVGGGNQNTNVAIGDSALPSNTTGYNNVAIGNSALFNNIGGVRNVGIGTYVLGDNTNGSYNTAIGDSIYGTTTGNYNTFIGQQIITGNVSNNIILGDGSGNMRLVFNSSGDAVLGGSTTYPTFSGFKLDVLGSGRYSGALTLSTIANATTDTDRFLVSDSGVIKYRTGAEILSDIGAQAALTNPITGTGNGGSFSVFTGSSTIGNSSFLNQGTNIINIVNADLNLPANNTVGGTNYGIRQQMATNDSWRIFGNSVALDQGELVFELADNGQPLSLAGQRFRFSYNAASSGSNKDALIIDYNTSTFQTGLDVTGSVILQGSVTGTANLSNYSVTASSGVARSKSITSTLVAAANNDVLVGLDIQPTFTVGAFTGTTSAAIRVAGDVIPSTTGTRNLGASTLRWGTVFAGMFNAAELYIDNIRTRASSLKISSNTNTQWAQFFESTGNLLLQNGGTFTDGGQRLQVTGTSYFSDSVGIGSTSISTVSLAVSKNITGGVFSYGVFQNGTVQSDVTSVGWGFQNQLKTQATTFTLPEYRHYSTAQGTIGAGSSITTQIGYLADNSLTGATNNYGFFGNIPSGTGRWNLYMNGTANNYLAGSLGIGATALTAINLRIGANITGGTVGRAVIANGIVQSDVTLDANGFVTQIGVASGFTLPALEHFYATQGTISGTLTNQYGFFADFNLTGATNNYGFYGNIAAGTGRWNLYMNGTADNYLAGSLGIGVTGLTGYSLRVERSITGATTAYGIQQNGQVQSDVTSAVYSFRSRLNTAAASFTLSSYYHFTAFQPTLGAGSAVTNQFGFFSENLTGATNNYGFYGGVTSGSNRWNLYMGGDANNFLAGALQVGPNTVSTGTSIRASRNITGATTLTSNLFDGSIQSDATGDITYVAAQTRTAASAFTVSNVYLFRAAQVSIGSTSAVTTQVAFYAEPSLIGATNNYGFYGHIASGSNRWNAYMAGTASNYLEGDTGIGTSSLGTATKFTLGGSETASSAIARGALVNTTLVAAANNDVLVGLDIAPTFTNGAFTGVRNFALRINGDIVPTGDGVGNIGQVSFAFAVARIVRIEIDNLRQRTTSGMFFSLTNGTNNGWFAPTTGNLVLQNGGTFTDAGYRLDVNGTARVQGKLSVNTPTETSAVMEVTSTTQGVLFPRMTSTQRDAISSPAAGLMIYNTTTGWHEYFDSFWGWMPKSINQEWQNRYGVYVYDPLSSFPYFYNRRTGGTGSLMTATSNAFISIFGYNGCNRGSTGSTTTGYATLHTQDGGSNPGIYLGYGIIKHQIQVALDTLSTATDEYIVISGFNTGSVTAAGQTSGLFFTYDRIGAANGTSASTNWQVVTRNGSVSTVTDSGVAVATNTRYIFEIRVNSNATSVTYYINGTLVATHTTNIPTTTQRLQTGIFKTAGTTGYNLYIANSVFQMKYNTPLY